MLRKDVFLGAQAAMYDDALAELRAGSKETHWIWFVFPQHVDLGVSERARLFGLTVPEAREFWGDDTLRGRLLTAVAAARQLLYLETALGSIDVLKFRSSLTLFEHVSDHEPLLTESIDHHFGERCGRTLQLLPAPVPGLRAS
jgi:uncharacterized protein (DUF1810 family)